MNRNKKRNAFKTSVILIALQAGILLIGFALYSSFANAETKYLGVYNTGGVFMSSNSDKCGLMVRKDKRVFFVCRQTLLKFWAGGLANYTYAVKGGSPINHTGNKSGNRRTLAIEDRHNREVIDAIRGTDEITITIYTANNELLTEVIDTSDFNDFLTLLEWDK